MPLRLLLVTDAEKIVALVRQAAGPGFVLLRQQDEPRHPDVVVFDATAPEPDTSVRVRVLQSRYPGVPVVVLVTDGASALLVLKEIIVEEVVSLSSGPGVLAEALHAAVSRGFLEELADHVEQRLGGEPDLPVLPGIVNQRAGVRAYGYWMRPEKPGRIQSLRHVTWWRGCEQALEGSATWGDSRQYRRMRRHSGD